MKKRIISMLLCMCLLLSLFPVPPSVGAVENTDVSSGNPTVEGTNSFGTLLSDELEEQQTADEEVVYPGGYKVVGLTIENGIATVEYDTLEKAILVVALYTEDGLQLLVSGNTTVQPEDSTVEVTLEGELPEYFMASAYLLDTYDYSPLCASYDTPMYTKEMQELLASTTDDYDADKVLNLDDDKTTNFAVYADTTKVLAYTEGVNTVISADDETATYVIGNADKNITALQTGDVFAYAYGENQILIVKVASVTVEGTTATITGMDLEMEEVFSYVKVESVGDTADITVDESTGNNDITYIGKVSDDVTVMSLHDPYVVNPVGDYTGKLSLGFELEKESGSLKYEGSLLLNLKVDFSYYVSTTRQFVELEIDTETKLAVKISGEAEFTTKLPSLNFSPIPAVSVGFKPELVLSVSTELEVSLSVGNKTGFSYENGKGVQDLSTSPKVEMDIDVEGKIFFGLDLGPAVGILGGSVAEIQFSALAGVELKAEMGGTKFDDFQLIGDTESRDSIHTCESCLEISLSAKIEFSLKLKFLNLSFLKFEFKLTDKVFDIGECYYSFDQQDFGWGSCPNKSYRVTVYVQNAQGHDAFGVDVVAGWTENLAEIPLGKTNSNGVVVYYLQTGTYTFMATVDGENLGKSVMVEESCKVTLDKNSIGGMPTFVSGIVNPDSMTDNGIVASGECGADGANVTWTLYGSGLLSIDGSGNMAAFSSASEIPWCNYTENIIRVVIDNGVTSIGSRAFYNCINMKQVEIPDSILTIASRAFYKCSGLLEVEIPANVSAINSYSFYECTSLKTVVLHNNITTINERAFAGCTSLNNITIPIGVSFIGYYAFDNCDSLSNVYIFDLASWCGITFDGYYSNPLSNGGKLYLGGELVTSVTLPDSIETVSEYLFHGCLSITEVIIPEGVTEIGAHAFESCDNLVTVTIPNTVTTIGGYAFCGSGITSLSIPDGVQQIPDLLCQWCENLTRLVIGKGVTYIGTDAFAFTSLEEIVFKGDAPTTIKYGAFRTISPIGYYPAGNVTWATFLENYSGTITWTPYTPIDNGTITSSGQCGADGDNVTYALYSNGLLKLEGTGSMANYSGSDVPWAGQRSQITAVEISSDVTNIGAYAFNGCNNLTSISISDSVTAIGERAFLNCRSLTRIDIPSSVFSISTDAFTFCNNLTEIVVANNNAYYSSDNQGILYNKAKTELITVPGGIADGVVIPASVSRIGQYAFFRCNSLTGISIPNTVTSVGERAFYGCGGLTSITIPSSVTSIGANAFSSCTSLVQITVADNNPSYSSDSQGILYNKDKTKLIVAPVSIAGDVVIPASVTSIGNNAFYSCSSLSSISIPDGATSIGDYAFFNCSSLTSINIPDGVISIGNYAFYNCSSLTGISIPNSVTSIGNYSFCGCGGLTVVNIPDSVTSIGEHAFARSSLTSVNISNSVTSIGNYAFYNCSGLIGVIIPTSVTSIGDYAFLNCDNLTIVYYSGSEAQWDDISIGSDNSCLTDATIHYNKTDVSDLVEYCEMHWGAKKLLSALNYFIGTFETVDDIDPDAFRKTIYLFAPAKISEDEQRIYTYQVSDLDRVSLSYFGVTYDWTQLSDHENIHYYDDATQTVIVKNPYPYIGGDGYEITSIEQLDSELCVVTCSLFSSGYFVGTGTLVMKKTQYGYVAVSFSEEAQTFTLPRSSTSPNSAEQQTNNENAPALYSIYDGEYSTEVTDAYTLKTAAFSGLVPGEQYVLLALVSIEVEDVLAPNNLLYIKQDAASEDGTLAFTYVQRETTDISYVMACGASHSNLSNADIIFPIMLADDEIHAVHPTVIYGEELLVEGKDYIIIGKTDYTTVGTYTCYIRGIYNYTGFVECQYTVKTIESIAITTLPSKLTYLEGTDVLDTTDGLLTITYGDGSTSVVDLTEDMVTGFDNLTVGNQTLTVSYDKYTTVYDIEIMAKDIESIAVSQSPSKLTYLEGRDNLDVTGGTLTLIYNNGTTEVVDMTPDMVSGYDNTMVGEQTLTVTYDDKTATFAVTIIAKSLTGISITKKPTKTAYIEGQPMDTTGLVVKASYNNGTTADIADYTLSGYSSTPGTKTITVSYGGKTATFVVTVNTKTLTGISVTAKPSKLTYLEGDALDTTGLQVQASYNNGTYAEVADYTVSGYSSTPGTKTITVSYGGKTATFTVTVNAKTLTGISVTAKPSKLTYLEGDKLDIAGLKVQANYNNGTYAEVADYTVSGYSSTPGTKTITVSYGGKTATFTVTVNAKTLTGISVTAKPLKLTYVQGEALDTAGLKVQASYNNGTTADVTGYTLSGFDTNKVGQQTVTVTYGGKTAAFTVTVESAVPDAITSDKHTVSAGFVRNISAGTTAADLAGGINEKEYIKVFSGDKEVSASTPVGTGMVIKLMDGNTVKASVTVVVSGDTNGDGKTTVTDMIAVKSHVLKKSTLGGAYAQAADTSADGGISITDFIQIKASILGKGTITPN